MSDSDKQHKCGNADELIAGPDLGDGTRPFIRHTADHQIVGGMLRTAKSGQPCNGCEVVALTPIDGSRYKVQTLYGGGADSERETKGPGKVVTDRYREGWDRTFGSKAIGQA